MTRIVMIATLAVLTGCATRPPAHLKYQLTPDKDGAILQPPMAMQGAMLELPKARSTAPNAADCDVKGDHIALAWKGRTARVKIDESAVAAAPAIALNGPQSPTGEQVRDLSWWPQFRADLLKHEARGCLARGESDMVAGRILQNLPLPPMLAYKLRFGDYLMDGYLDLGPQFALKSVSPILKPGIEKYRVLSDVAGYETAYYDVEQGGGGALKLALRSVQHQGGATPGKALRPAGAALRITNSPRHVRLFFRTWRVAGEYRVALLATREAGTLDAMTADFEKDPERFCRESARERATCLSVPMEMMLTAEMRVHANGKPAYVPVGGNVRELLTLSGIRQPGEVIKSLQVQRLYEGVLTPVEFDRTRQDILGLTLIGGEDIRW